MTPIPRLAPIASIAWLLGFGVLARWGTWLPFAFAGAILTVLMLRTGAVGVETLRPSRRHFAIGVFTGALMVLLTHLAYAAVAALVPSVLPATRELFWLLNVEGFSAPERATLIVVIASCEEVLFRGPLLGSGRAARKFGKWRFERPHLSRVCAWAAAYALTTLPLASPLLTLCAFVCGGIWGVLAVATGSLTVPILVHAIWDLGVLIVWPLTTRP